ncbi:MAG: hypothetical protein IKA93_03590, partial [Elusimicrobiaceae bacterium]|nr:hypothetical protein [Elusimicrobiaceae bacterium]
GTGPNRGRLRKVFKVEYKNPLMTEKVIHAGRPTLAWDKSCQVQRIKISAQKSKLINANIKIPTFECWKVREKIIRTSKQTDKKKRYVNDRDGT